jgi:formylglycine-generating enzyme required for sulfatase activity
MLVDFVGVHSTKGDGKWGQADLSGNVWEWNVDWWVSYVTPCINCAYLSGSTKRVIRGGSFSDDAASLTASVRNGALPTNRSVNIGARCARTP